SHVTWGSDRQNIVTVDAHGVMTGHDRGRANVQANYGFRHALTAVVVVPRDTYVVSGTVKEAGLPVDSAAVSLRSASEPSGLSQQTGFDGRYEFFGIAGDSRLDVSKQGYLTRSETVTVDADRTFDVALTPTVAPVNVAGTYE